MKKLTLGIFLAIHVSSLTLRKSGIESFFLNSAKAAFPLLSMSAAALVTSASTCFALSDGGGACWESVDDVAATNVVSASPASKALAFMEPPYLTDHAALSITCFVVLSG
jgi:hypothetical protein